MSVKLRLALIAGAGVIAMGILSAWQVAEFTTKEQQELLRQNLTREAAVTARLASLQSSQFATRLSYLVSVEHNYRRTQSQPNRVNPSRVFLNSEFVMLSLLELQSGQWQPQWVATQAGYASQWPSSFAPQVLSGLPYARTQKGTTVWYRVRDPQNRSLFAVVIEMNVPGSRSKVRAVGLLPTQAFAEVTEPFKGTQREFVVIDERGYALAYSEQQYVGASLKDHPVVSRILAQRKVGGTWSSQDLKGEPVIASYERLQQSNVYVAVVAKSQTQWAAATALMTELGVFAVAILIGMIAIGFVILNPMLVGFRSLRGAVIAVAEGRLPTLPPNIYIEPVRGAISSLMNLSPELDTGRGVPKKKSLASYSDQELQEQRTAAYKQIGKGLSQAMKGPIAAVLGHAQLARSKVTEQSLKDHFVVIEREARRAREMVENLIRLTGDESKERKRVDLQEVVLAALAQVRPAISNKGVRLNKNLKANGHMMAHQGQLQAVIEELLNNAIDSMTEQTRKELSVTTVQTEERIKLIIEDTGSGISEAEYDRIFEPFYTTKDPDENAGLGLTVAKGVIESFKGHIHIEPSPDGGVKVVAEFPLASANKERLVAISDAEEKEVLEMPTPADEEAESFDSTTGSNPPGAPSEDEWVTAGAKVDHKLSVVKDEGAAKPVHRPTHRPGDKAPEPSQATGEANTLIGKKPLSGTQASQLPTPPDEDEMTMVGQHPDHDKIFESLGQEFQVTIRRPKVRGKN